MISENNELIKLQAEAYRLIRLIEQAQMKLQQINLQIQKIENSYVTESTDLENDKKMKN